MKVVFLLGCLEIGGAEQQAMLLARWLKEEHGADVEMWGVSHGGRLAERCENAGIPWQVTGNPFVGKFTEIVWRLLGISRRLRKSRVDVILSYTLVPNIIAGIVWWISGASLCVWNQRDEGMEGHREPFERWAVRLTPLFLANSSSCADYVIRNLRVDSKKVSVIHNGIALNPPEEGRSVWRQRLGLTNSAVCVAMIANLSTKKDHATLLSAWHSVIATLSPLAGELQLVLAGRLDDAAAAVSNLVSSLGLKSYVSMIGPVRDVAGLLEAVDIGVYSSFSEGLPNGVIELMATGKAVAATDIPGVREALGDGYSFLSRPGDSDEMAAHLLTLITDPVKRHNIGRHNRDRAVAQFDTRSMCQNTASVLFNRLPGFQGKAAGDKH